jgi:hypothetical protein
MRLCRQRIHRSSATAQTFQRDEGITQSTHCWRHPPLVGTESRSTYGSDLLFLAERFVISSHAIEKYSRSSDREGEWIENSGVML